jgi:hypothetical protein
MNQLDELIRSTLDQNAQDAPPAAAVVARVLEHEPRRRYRTPWLATAAVATATAAVVAVGVTQLGGDDTGVTSGRPGRFTDREITYAEDSTIHYGDRTIDVAPHEVRAFVATDDGFVLVNGDDDVYFADGTGVERVGHVSGWAGDRLITAGAMGSYAAWIDGGEVVVYDTARGAEALREPVPGDGSGSAVAVDGNRAFVSTDNRVDAWDIDRQTKRSYTRPRSYDEIRDAANGHLVWESGVVSRDPEASEPVFGRVSGMDETHLSPNGRYVAGGMLLFERKSHQDITPDLGRPVWFEVIMQWLDNDRYVADTVSSLDSTDVEAHDLLVCSASGETCEVAVELTEAIVYPNGLAREGG